MAREPGVAPARGDHHPPPSAPFGRSGSLAKDVAAGDLRRSVPPGGLGEVGTLVAALDHMAGSLRALVGTISNVADRTARRGGQLLEHAEAQGMAEHAGAARGASELTRRTVEENRARMASVAEEVERVSEIARQTDLLALNAGMEAAGPARPEEASPSSPARFESSPSGAHERRRRSTPPYRAP